MLKPGLSAAACKSGVLFLFLMLALSPIAAHAQEFDTNRPGSDYRDLDLSAPRWQDCQNMCTAAARCLSWTYVKPGVQAANARCWLKRKIPPKVASSCCISGLKNPTTVGKESFAAPSLDGVRVDYCAEVKTFSGQPYRNGCGRDAAHAFCKRVGYVAATFWDIDSSSGPGFNTVYPKTLQRCFFDASQAVTRCRGFEVIVCT